jgi:hypothetical protein
MMLRPPPRFRLEIGLGVRVWDRTRVRWRWGKYKHRKQTNISRQRKGIARKWGERGQERRGGDRQGKVRYKIMQGEANGWISEKDGREVDQVKSKTRKKPKQKDRNKIRWRGKDHDKSKTIPKKGMKTKQ